MDSTFLSKENLDNIYDYLNAKVVSKYNINLDTNEKYRKIIKKLSKTIYKTLNSQIKNMSINEFNELVVYKSLPFIKTNLDKCKQNIINDVKSNNSGQFNKSINYSNINNSEINIDLNKSVKLISEDEYKNKNKNKNKKTKTKTNSKKPTKQTHINEYDSYLKDALEFESVVKQSNNRIKNNFKDLIKNNEGNFIKQCEGEDVDKFVMNRCIAKDNVKEKGLSKSAFEEIVENEILYDK